MRISFGAYNIWTHELDQKLSVQITSDLGEVHVNSDESRESDFPNEVCLHIDNPSGEIEAMGLKKFAFGQYTFILGINFKGELYLFHSVLLNVGKKVIDGKDTLSLAFLKEPKN